jgi:hypothetical protein
MARLFPPARRDFVPYSAGMGGKETGSYPFTGHGFTSARNGQVIQLAFRIVLVNLDE